MIPWRGALYAITLLGVAALVIWLGRLSGDVRVVVADVEYYMRLPVAILVLVALLMLGGGAFWLLRAVYLWPGRYRARWLAQQKSMARDKLADAYLALGRGDLGAARDALALADKRLPDEVLPQIMSVHLAIETGAHEAARHRLEQLHVSHPQLAEQGLFQLARATHDPQAARAVLTETLRRDRKNRWALHAGLTWAVRAGEWDEALRLAPQLQAAGLWSRAELRHYRAVLTVGALADQEVPDLALRRAAERAARDWEEPPAIVQLARLYAAQGHVKKARQKLAQAWKRAPHPDLAEGFLNIHHDVPLDQQNRLAIAFVRGQAEHPESLILRARIALKARRWAQARQLLAVLVNPQSGDESRADRHAENSAPSRRLCVLMAEICAGEQDTGGARSWRDRAVSAPEDASWHGDGERLAHWAAASPSGRLGEVQWGHPTRVSAGVSAGPSVGVSAG